MWSINRKKALQKYKNVEDKHMLTDFLRYKNFEME
jgi:hypothetical protein